MAAFGAYGYILVGALAVGVLGLLATVIREKSAR